jgi:hypothetical protein
MMKLGVFVEQLLIRFGNANDLNIIALQRHIEEARYVAMRQTDDGDLERRRGNAGGEQG